MRSVSPGEVAVQPDPGAVVRAARTGWPGPLRPGSGPRCSSPPRLGAQHVRRRPPEPDAEQVQRHRRRATGAHGVDDPRLGGAQVGEQRRRPAGRARSWCWPATPRRSARRGRRTRRRGSPASSRRARPASARRPAAPARPARRPTSPAPRGPRPAGHGHLLQRRRGQHVAGVAEQEGGEPAEVGQRRPELPGGGHHARRRARARAARRRPRGAPPCPAAAAPAGRGSVRVMPERARAPRRRTTSSQDAAAVPGDQLAEQAEAEVGVVEPAGRAEHDVVAGRAAGRPASRRAPAPTSRPGSPTWRRPGARAAARRCGRPAGCPARAARAGRRGPAGPRRAAASRRPR